MIYGTMDPWLILLQESAVWDGRGQGWSLPPDHVRCNPKDSYLHQLACDVQLPNVVYGTVDNEERSFGRVPFGNALLTKHRVESYTHIPLGVGNGDFHLGYQNGNQWILVWPPSWPWKLRKDDTFRFASHIWITNRRNRGGNKPVWLCRTRPFNYQIRMMMMCYASFVEISIRFINPTWTCHNGETSWIFTTLEVGDIPMRNHSFCKTLRPMDTEIWFKTSLLLVHKLQPTIEHTLIQRAGR